MPDGPTEPVRRMSLEIHSDEDWVGTIEVGYYQDLLSAFWWWKVSNGKAHPVDGGVNAEITGPQTPRQAMRVLLLFLLAAAHQPVESFNGALHEWARMQHTSLARALGEL